MARDLNLVMLMGYVGQDPEVTYAGERGRANFSLAVKESWKNNAGEKQEKTMWVNCTVFVQSLVNLVGEYIRKGSRIQVSGKLDIRDVEDSSGNKKRYAGVLVNDIYFLNSKNGDGQSDSKPAPKQAQKTQADYEGGDDDIPF